MPRLVERLRSVGAHWWAPLALIAAFVVNLTGIPGTPLTIAAEAVRDAEGEDAPARLTNVALLRLVHVFPFAAISYAAGLAGVKLRDYLIGTLIGTLPGVLIYTYLADAILRGLVSTGQAALRIGVAAVLLGVLIVVSRWLARKVNR